MLRTIFSIILLGAAGAVLFMYIRPAYDAIAPKKAEIANYEAALNKAAELQKLKQSLLAKQNSFNPADLERLHKLLPDHVDNVALILDIDHLAGVHGMGLENVDVNTPGSVRGGATQSQPPSSMIGAGSGQTYDSLTLTFTTHGTYQPFLDFMRDLERSLRIVDLTSLSISPTSGLGFAEPVYTYKITLRTYWLK